MPNEEFSPDPVRSGATTRRKPGSVKSPWAHAHSAASELPDQRPDNSLNSRLVVALNDGLGSAGLMHEALKLCERVAIHSL